MKIEGTKSAQSSDKSRKKGAVQKSDGSFGSMVTGGAADTKKSSNTQSIAGVDALLAVQGAEDPTARAAKKRMRVRGESILDGLDRIRMSILTGTLTVGEVIQVADMVASHREKIMDPRLTAVLDEIDLRAQVELTKIRVSVGDAF